MHTVRKIFVGVSGGVDSSVSAYLLKKQGHDVHGVYIKPWSPPWLPCTWVAEKRDAMRVCAALDIPFHFLDGSEAYKQSVAEYMIDEYRVGRTPNPDVLCNRVIKFGLMWEYAKSNGADAIATGHYAQIHMMAEPSRVDNIGSDTGMKIDLDPARNTPLLRRGADDGKDQSYFLWMLKRDELEHIEFPIGQLKKTRVREIAKDAGLPTAEKKDSQGICFLGQIDLKDFLRQYITEKEGDVVDERGLIVGAHHGVWFYTVGERHGFTITEPTANRRPYYVIGKDMEKNRLIVSKNPDAIARGATITVKLRNFNWLIQPSWEKTYTVQIRYHGVRLKASVSNQQTVTIDGESIVPFGQSIVVYDGDTVVGGGIIAEHS